MIFRSWPIRFTCRIPRKVALASYIIYYSPLRSENIARFGLLSIHPVEVVFTYLININSVLGSGCTSLMERCLIVGKLFALIISRKVSWIKHSLVQVHLYVIKSFLFQLELSILCSFV